MGNSYTHLATCEPSEISTTSGLTYSKSTKATNSFASFNQISTHKMYIIRICLRASTRSYVKYPVMRPAVHSDAIGALASIRPGMILSGGRDKIISLNNIDTGECVLKWFGHEKEVTKVIFLEQIKLASSRAPIAVYIISSVIVQSPQNNCHVKIAYVNAGGKHHIISGSRDSLIKLWQFNSPKSSKNYSGHQMSVTGITVLNESRFVSGARDASLKLWDITSGDIIQSVQQSRNIV
ncbi:unnamed protein product [Dracunculus medinensis]|uniref:WD_REPEATS_REGION domain-containing protein n=1 Tax=Dracunculus medinensis TaxID=318479 RepID=A0A0N4UI59_DRAME|nr:unnamed protein product [Dracunculus medinensis]